MASYCVGRFSDFISSGKRRGRGKVESNSTGRLRGQNRAAIKNRQVTPAGSNGDVTRSNGMVRFEERMSMKKQQMQRILLSGSAVFALSATATFAADKTAPSREQSVPMEIAVGGLLPVEQAEISAQFSNWLEQERPAGVREAAARI